MYEDFFSLINLFIDMAHLDSQLGYQLCCVVALNLSLISLQ